MDFTAERTAFCLCLSAEDVLMAFPPGRTAHLPGSEGSSVWCHLWKRLVCFPSAVYFAFRLLFSSYYSAVIIQVIILQFNCDKKRHFFHFSKTWFSSSDSSPTKVLSRTYTDLRSQHVDRQASTVQLTWALLTKTGRHFPDPWVLARSGHMEATALYCPGHVNWAGQS